MKVSRRLDHGTRLFLFRTVSAQLHAIGCLLFLGEAFILLPYGMGAGTDHLFACLSYLVTGVFVFAISSTYHFLYDGFEICSNLERRLENLDHFGIYLFIAGTYSPFLLHTVSPEARLPLIIGIWSIAIVGILYTWLKPSLPAFLQHRTVYTLLFVVMGWFLLLRAGEIFPKLTPGQLGLFVAGCGAYCVGAVIYARKWPSLFEGWFGYHELWHVMVVLGAQFHFFLILSFYTR